MSDFQSGAVQLAHHEGIELFRVRDLTENEWQKGSKASETFASWVFRTPMRIEFPGIHSWDRDMSRENIEMSFIRGVMSANRVAPAINCPGSTIEDVIINITREAAVEAATSSSAVFGGVTGVRRMIVTRDRNFAPPISLPRVGGSALIPKISFDIGVLIHEPSLRDRTPESSLFALAVEDSVKGTVSSATRHSRDDPTRFLQLNLSQSEEKRHRVQIVVVSDPFFTLDLKGLRKGKVYDSPGKSALDFNSGPIELR